jgi:hypothetical protein
MTAELDVATRSPGHPVPTATPRHPTHPTPHPGHHPRPDQGTTARPGRPGHATR